MPIHQTIYRSNLWLRLSYSRQKVEIVMFFFTYFATLRSPIFSYVYPRVEVWMVNILPIGYRLQVWQKNAKYLKHNMEHLCIRDYLLITHKRQDNNHKNCLQCPYNIEGCRIFFFSRTMAVGIKNSVAGEYNLL